MSTPSIHTRNTGSRTTYIEHKCGKHSTGSTETTQHNYMQSSIARSTCGGESEASRKIASLPKRFALFASNAATVLLGPWWWSATWMTLRWWWCQWRPQIQRGRKQHIKQSSTPETSTFATAERALLWALWICWKIESKVGVRVCVVVWTHWDRSWWPDRDKAVD